MGVGGRGIKRAGEGKGRARGRGDGKGREDSGDQMGKLACLLKGARWRHAHLTYFIIFLILTPPSSVFISLFLLLTTALTLFHDLRSILQSDKQTCYTHPPLHFYTKHTQKQIPQNRHKQAHHLISIVAFIIVPSSPLCKSMWIHYPRLGFNLARGTCNAV